MLNKIFGILLWVLWHIFKMLGAKWLKKLSLFSNDINKYEEKKNLKLLCLFMYILTKISFDYIIK